MHQCHQDEFSHNYSWKKRFSLRLIAFIWQVTETAATAETHISKCITYASDGTACANVGLSSTISADRNISPPRQINLDIKVMTGAVITWCNLNPELFSSHPAWWIHTNAAVMLFFVSVRRDVWFIKAQIWSNEKQRRSFSAMVSVVVLLWESIYPDRGVVSVQDGQNCFFFWKYEKKPDAWRG